MSDPRRPFVQPSEDAKREVLKELNEDGFALNVAIHLGDSGALIFRRVAGTNVSLVGIFWGGGNGISRFSSMENITDLDGFGPYTVTSPP